MSVVFWPGHEAVAERAFRAAVTPLPMPGIGRVASRATIFLAPDPAAFDSLTGGRVPHWAAGVAMPELRAIVLPVYASERSVSPDPIVALRHELVHLALRDHLGGGVPRWFDEGYATWASGEFDRSAGWQIRLALLRGAAPPLDSLTLRWPAAEPQARLAYLLAASAVDYLASRNGEVAFASFLRRWQANGDIDEALRATYLINVERFQREWRTMVRQRYGWLLAIAQVGFFWGMASVLFVALGFIRRRRDRQKLAAMVEAERLEPPPEEGEVEEWREEWTDEENPPER